MVLKTCPLSRDFAFGFGTIGWGVVEGGQVTNFIPADVLVVSQDWVYYLLEITKEWVAHFIVKEGGRS